MNPALNALSFLIGSIFSFYAMIVAIRFLMQAFRVDYYNPLAQFVVKMTDPPLRPLRRIIPGWGGLDMAALILCLLVIFLKLLTFKLLALESVPAAGDQFRVALLGAPHLIILALLDLLNLFFNILIFSIVIMALMSWIIQDPGHPMYAMLNRLTAPVLAPVRRYVPPIGGLDLSALVAILGLITIKLFVMGMLVKGFFG